MNLPKEFNFKSNVNPLSILYHAEETEYGYKVTCNWDTDVSWKYSKEEMEENLLNGDYVIVGNHKDHEKHLAKLICEAMKVHCYCDAFETSCDSNGSCSNCLTIAEYLLENNVAIKGEINGVTYETLD